ncbi:hypothetical protein HDK90DRAFT_222453 [Phyllosticta capitalensis]|uniref:Secreted protein n=1 Tax=Phyllosticta capitalensis TaxID=121624 RepID=A0ABR1YUD6_9PEZI
MGFDLSLLTGTAFFPLILFLHSSLQLRCCSREAGMQYRKSFLFFVFHSPVSCCTANVPSLASGCKRRATSTCTHLYA